MLIRVRRLVATNSQDVHDDRYIPVESIRSFSVVPIVDSLTSFEFTAQSATELRQAGVEEAVVVKVETIIGNTYLGEDALRNGLLNDAQLTQDGYDRFFSQLRGSVEEGAVEQVFRQMIALFELNSARPLGPLASANNATNQPSAAFTPVALLTNLGQLNAFEQFIETEVTSKLQAGQDIDVTYSEFT